MRSPKQIRKDLAAVLVPVCNHLKKHGTDKYTDQLEYDVKSKHDNKVTTYRAKFEPHGDRMIEVTVEFFFSLTLKFLVPIDQIQHMVAELQAQRFAEENNHIVEGVHKFQKDIH